MYEHSIKKHAKNVLVKVIRKTWKNIKKGIGKETQNHGKTIKNEVQKMSEQKGGRTDAAGQRRTHGGDFGGSLLVRFNRLTVKHRQ